MKNAAPELRLVMTVDEAATALCLSAKTVRKFISSGELKACRVGRRVLLSVPTLEAFIRDHEGEVTP